MSSSSGEARLYGGWRESRGVGMNNLDTRQTVAVLVTVGVVLTSVTIWGLAGLFVTLPFAAAFLFMSLYRRNGVVALDIMVAWARHQSSALRGETRQVASVVQEWPVSDHLPGVLASTVLLDVEVPGMSRAGAVWDQASGRIAITVLVDATGTLLSDREDAERSVANWGNFLASLSEIPQVEAAMVTLDLRPGAGGALRADTISRMRADASEVSVRVLEQLHEQGPARSTRTERWVTMVFNPAKSTEKLRGPHDAVSEALRIVNGLSIASSGAMVRRLATSNDIKRIVRTSYEPSLLSQAVDEEEWEALRWGECGPDGADELPDRYEHNGATSVSYALAAAPRQRVGHGVLLPLLRPGRHARRVTLMYRVASTEEAGRIVEMEETAASARREMRSRAKKDPSARLTRDEQLARRTAAQEAAGAALVRFSAVITTTVDDVDDLDAAKAELMQAAGSSKMKLRLARHGQGALFSVGLPCGIYPPAIAKASRRRYGRTLGLPPAGDLDGHGTGQDRTGRDSTGQDRTGRGDAVLADGVGTVPAGMSVGLGVNLGVGGGER